MLSMFSYVYWPSVCPFGDESVQVFDHFLIGLFHCFGVEAGKFFANFGC